MHATFSLFEIQPTRSRGPPKLGFTGLGISGRKSFLQNLRPPNSLLPHRSCLNINQTSAQLEVYKPTIQALLQYLEPDLRGSLGGGLLVVAGAAGGL